MGTELIKDLIIQKVKREFTGEVSLESVVAFMCDNLPLNSIHLRNVVIREEFDRRYKELTKKNNTKPTSNVMLDLSIEFDCSKRNIERIIYNEK